PTLPATGVGDFDEIRKAAGEVADLPSLCRGGPARWKEPVRTGGSRGTGSGAYVVDTVHLPDKNPWNSWMRLGGLDFFPDGRAAVCTFSGDVWIVSSLDASLENATWKRFATCFCEPLGLKILAGSL